MMVPGFGPSNRHDEPPVLHALQTDQPAGELFDLSGLAMNNEDFQAGIMVEMRMTGRNHQFVVCMLEFGQFLGNAVGVMVVDERDGADYRRIGACCPLCDQAIANQVPESLGPVGIAQPGDEIVEALEEIRIECYSDSAKDTHGHSCDENLLSREKNENGTISKFVARLSTSISNPERALCDVCH
jgi:hypothetical protein